MCAPPPLGAARPAPAAGARGCVIAALFVFAAVLLTVPAVARAWRARAGTPAATLRRGCSRSPSPGSRRATGTGGGRCAPSSKRCRGGGSAVALQPRLRACGGRDPGARDADLARARRRRPARRDRRRARGGRGARRLRPGALPGIALGRRRCDRRGRVRGPARRLRRGHAGTLARGGRAGGHRPAPRPGRRRGDRRRLAGRPLADRCLEGMGPRPADRRAARPRLRRRAGGAGGRGRHRGDPAPRYGAGSSAACWSSPSG